ncbi:MAG: hypothetical protein H6707_02555 [Deltaproteobacteria bacterium]|nr:hypothetical protein [Deltaproteobacteria bacterium]
MKSPINVWLVTCCLIAIAGCGVPDGDPTDGIAGKGESTRDGGNADNAPTANVLDPDGETIAPLSLQGSWTIETRTMTRHIVHFSAEHFTYVYPTARFEGNYRYDRQTGYLTFTDTAAYNTSQHPETAMENLCGRHSGVYRIQPIGQRGKLNLILVQDACPYRVTQPFAIDGATMIPSA